MKIGIDIRNFSFSRESRAGWYQYTYNLVSNLLAIDFQNNYTLLSTLRHGKGFEGDERIVSRFVRRLPGRLTELLLERLSVPIEFLLGKIDIFHGPCYFVPSSLHCKSIVTIHDLMFLRHPEFLRQEWVASLNKDIYASVKRADAVITVSNFTKGEIIELLNVPADKIKVIYNGIASCFYPVQDRLKIEDIKSKYGIKSPYLIFVGNIEPKKNIETLILACAELRKSTTYKYPLVVVGKKAWHFETVWEVVKQLHGEEDTIFTDVVDGNDLPLLYSGAELFIFPSLFEGFGIPVIEAMACGTPVVASNRTSIPEISGDAALLYDPLNVDEMRGAMYNVLSNPSLRGQLVEKGFERAKYFSWEKTARETLKLYQEM